MFFVDGYDGDLFCKKTGKMPEHFMRSAKSESRSCESCDSNENGHYCLLHTHQIKNANLIVCDDFEIKQKEDA